MNRPFHSISYQLILVTLIVACQAQGSASEESRDNDQIELPVQHTSSPPIADFVVQIFQDSKGDMWFGTMSRGVARYDGEKLTYFSTKDGLAGNTVASIAEDREGNLWFGTHSGLSKGEYLPDKQGLLFTNFTTRDGLIDDRVSNLLIDRTGTMWVGTWGGVSKYTAGQLPVGKVEFTDLPLPVPKVELLTYQSTMEWVTELMEDSHGNIWIGRDGYGASKYDGETFIHFTKKDGLPSNNVQAIHEDRKGNIWFGTRVAETDNPDRFGRTGDGGLTRYDGKSFRQFHEQRGLTQNSIYTIYEVSSGGLWIGATGVGVYRVEGETFTLYKETDRADLMHSFGVQDILEDRNGHMWFGFSGGLFRFDGSSFRHVTQDGPWQ